MKTIRRILSGSIAFLVAGVVLAGLAVNAPYAGDETDTIAIQNSGYTNQFQVGRKVEFCFTNNLCALFLKISNIASIQWERISGPYSQQTNNAEPLCNTFPEYMCCVAGKWERLPTWSWIGSGPVTNFDVDKKYSDATTWGDMTNGTGQTQCVPVTPALYKTLQIRIRTITPAGNSDWCMMSIPGQSCSPNGCP